MTLVTFDLCSLERVKLRTRSSSPKHSEWKRSGDVCGCKKRGIAFSSSCPGNSASLHHAQAGKNAETDFSGGGITDLRRCEWCRAKDTARLQHKVQCCSDSLEGWELLSPIHTQQLDDLTCEMTPAGEAGTWPVERQGEQQAGCQDPPQHTAVHKDTHPEQ